MPRPHELPFLESLLSCAIGQAIWLGEREAARLTAAGQRRNRTGLRCADGSGGAYTEADASVPAAGSRRTGDAAGLGRRLRRRKAARTAAR